MTRESDAVIALLAVAVVLGLLNLAQAMGWVS